MKVIIVMRNHEVVRVIEVPLCHNPAEIANDLGISRQTTTVVETQKVKIMAVINRKYIIDRG